MPSRKGWVTVLPEELWVCAAAEATRRRPAAPPERARYMCLWFVDCGSFLKLPLPKNRLRTGHPPHQCTEGGPSLDEHPRRSGGPTAVTQRELQNVKETGQKA